MLAKQMMTERLQEIKNPVAKEPVKRGRKAKSVETEKQLDDYSKEYQANQAKLNEQVDKANSDYVKKTAVENTLDDNDVIDYQNLAIEDEETCDGDGSIDTPGI
jgi:hypothetical protein